MRAAVGAVFCAAIAGEEASAKGALHSPRQAKTTAAMSFFFIASLQPATALHGRGRESVMGITAWCNPLVFQNIFQRRS